MKDKREVIKALELCATPESSCRDCPYDDDSLENCMNRAMRDAAELLKNSVEPLVIEGVGDRLNES